MTERCPCREAAPTIPMWLPSPEDMDRAEAVARRQWACQNSPPRLTSPVCPQPVRRRRPRWLGSPSTRAVDTLLLYAAVVACVTTCAIAVATWGLVLR